MSKVIQVRDVPDETHRRLKVRAAQERRSLSELVRAELEEIAARPTMAEMMERLASLAPVDGPESASAAIHAGRVERERQLFDRR